MIFSDRPADVNALLAQAGAVISAGGFGVAHKLPGSTVSDDEISKRQ